VQGFGRAGARARPAHPDPCRLRRRRHLRRPVCQASRPSRHLDHEFEERGFRQVARRRKGIAYDRENYLEQGGVYDIVYDTLGGTFAIDAFKVVSVAAP